MIEILKLFPLILLILTHPLEPISLDDYNNPKPSILLLSNSNYIAPNNGYIKEIKKIDDLFQMHVILDSGAEIVFSGLTEVLKNNGDRINKNELLGKDVTITKNTKFILMFHNNTEHFPQFKSQNLTFNIDPGTRLYMVAEGVITAQDLSYSSFFPLLYDFHDNNGFYTQAENGKPVVQSYIPNVAGFFSQIKLTNRNSYISYWHLQAFYAKRGDMLKQGDLLVYSGNTGASESPRLVLHINDEELGNDIRVIYYKDGDY